MQFYKCYNFNKNNINIKQIDTLNKIISNSIKYLLLNDKKQKK